MFGGIFFFFVGGVLIIVYIAFTCMFCSTQIRIMESINFKFVKFIRTSKYLCAEIKFLRKIKVLGF